MTSESIDLFFHHLPILKENFISGSYFPEVKNRILTEFWSIGRSMNLTDRELTYLIFREILDDRRVA